jgi:hypothetical protein
VGNLTSDRAATKTARENPRPQTRRKYVVGVGEVEGGKPKIHYEEEAIIDFHPFEGIAAGKVCWAEGFTCVW